MQNIFNKILKNGLVRGNVVIDKFIQDTQLSVTYNGKVLE